MFQQLLNLSSSEKYMSDPILGDLSNNRWSGVLYCKPRWEYEANRWELVLANDFAYNSARLVLLANFNRYEVDSDVFFVSVEALCPFKILPCPNYYISFQYFVTPVNQSHFSTLYIDFISLCTVIYYRCPFVNLYIFIFVQKWDWRKQFPRNFISLESFVTSPNFTEYKLSNALGVASVSNWAQNGAL